MNPHQAPPNPIFPVNPFYQTGNPAVAQNQGLLSPQLYLAQMSNPLNPLGLSPQQMQMLQMQQQQLMQLPLQQPLMFNILPNVYDANKPIGEYPDDDQILLNALCTAKANGTSYRLAMEGLHGRNHHSASAWKDYYLDNMSDINEKLSRPNANGVKTAKKPHRFQSSDYTPSSQSSRDPMPKRAAHATESLASTSQRLPNRIPSTVRPSWAQYKSLVPSRSPSPPNTIIPGPHGNAYTPADQQFFMNYIAWELNKNCALTKGELVAGLALKVPHHSKYSWARYWSRLHLAEELLAAAHCSSTNRVARDEEDWEDQRSQSQDSGDDYVPDGGDDVPVGNPKMGITGQDHTPADLDAMAQWVARYSEDEWSKMTNKEKWHPFSEQYTQRTLKSWTEGWQTRKAEILQRANRYRDEAHGKRKTKPASYTRDSHGATKRRRFEEFSGRHR